MTRVPARVADACAPRPLPESETALLWTQKPDVRLIEDAWLNAETPLERLAAPITPIDAFFVRNNGRLPPISAEQAAAWTLTVDGVVASPRTWTLDELRRDFETVTVTAVMECAGNGRFAFDPPPDGLTWGPGAVGCARWTGIRLADVLAAVSPRRQAVYTAHHGPDVTDEGRPALSRGLPLARTGDPDILLAFGMNGEPLPYLHGGPLRVVAPGFPGSAWQKWLNRLEIRDREHDGPKMTGTDYRLPRVPLKPGDPLDPTLFDVITEVPVKSLIVSPTEGFTARPGETVTVAGQAWSGRVPVDHVLVSGDGGRTWQTARLGPKEGRYAWARFEGEVVLGPDLVVMARAVDAEGAMQPLDPPWNPRGYGNNAVQRVLGRRLA